MSTRLQLVNKLNRLLSDTPEIQTINELVGDGASTVFKISKRPIVPASESITVAGVAQTRDTNYTIDNENAIVTFTSTPVLSAAIAGSFQDSYYSPQAKIDYINEAHTDWLFTETFDNILLSASARTLSDMESSETWTNGTADTIFYRTGSQGISLTSASDCSRTITWDLRGTDDDEIVIGIYTSDTDDVTTITLKLHSTLDTNLVSYNLKSELTDGFKYVKVKKSAFTSTGSPNWAAITTCEFEYTGTATIVIDQILIQRADEYSYIYALPSDLKILTGVYIYDDKGNRKSEIRRYRIVGSNLHLEADYAKGRLIGISYLKNFASLSADGTSTALPVPGEQAAILYAAYCLVRDKETLSARFDELPTNFPESNKPPATQIRTADYFWQKFLKARANAKLSATHIGTTTIHN